MSSRAAILARIARQAGNESASLRAAHAKGYAASSSTSTPPSPSALVTQPAAFAARDAPDGSATDPAERITRFTDLAAANQMSVVRVHALDHVPAAVRAYLGEEAMRHPVVVDTLLDIAAGHWGRAGLQCSHADTNPDGDIYIREGFAAIVECGAVVIASGAGRSLRNDFLAHTHIVVVPLARLLPGFGDLWAMLRTQRAAAGIAREVCLITGPSRTADLGVPAKLGAHGPACVHVLLVGSAA